MTQLYAFLFLFFFLRIFPEEQLVCTLRDFFLAGSETTTTTLKWSLAFLVNHQEIQAKMRAEIDDVIGSRPVSLADRDKMPISDAVLTETLRAGNIAPFALPHTASYDVTFNGYLIPKGATIWPCLDSVMNDDDMFTDPEHFKPERFLDSEGKRLGNEKSVISFSLGKLPHSASKSLAQKYIFCIFQEFLEEEKTILTYPRVFENVIITFLLLWFFSVSTFSGRRVCLGESLARMEMFLFLVTIIQRFELKSSPTHRTPSLHGVVGTAHAPRPYHICAVERT